MERLRFVVESLQGLSAGQMELEGEALQGLTGLLEGIYLDLLTEQRQAVRRLDDLQKRFDLLVQAKSDDIAAAFFNGAKP